MSAQFVMQAIVSTKEHVMDCYPLNRVGWGTTIDLPCELATERDIKRLSVYCADSKYDRNFGNDDLEIYKSWISAFRGENFHYLIRYEISRREDWEPEEEDLF